MGARRPVRRASRDEYAANLAASRIKTRPPFAKVGAVAKPE